nr:hypothetical protein [Tanacetum cinerariifolium]
MNLSDHRSITCTQRNAANPEFTGCCSPQLGLGVKLNARLTHFFSYIHGSERLACLALGGSSTSLEGTKITSTNWRHPWDLNSNYKSYRMTGSVIKGNSDNQVETPPLTKEQIEGHIYALKSLTKDHNKKNTVDPIRPNLELEDTNAEGSGIMKGKTVGDTNLRNPFKETLRTSLTRKMDNGDWVYIACARGREDFLIHGLTRMS